MLFHIVVVMLFAWRDYTCVFLNWAQSPSISAWLTISDNWRLPQVIFEVLMWDWRCSYTFHVGKKSSCHLQTFISCMNLNIFASGSVGCMSVVAGKSDCQHLPTSHHWCKIITYDKDLTWKCTAVHALQEIHSVSLSSVFDMAAEVFIVWFFDWFRHSWHFIAFFLCLYSTCLYFPPLLLQWPNVST